MSGAAALSRCGEPADAELRDLPTIEEARRRALALASPVAEQEWVALAAACGRVAGSDVIAPLPLPLHDHSAVDGFALGGLDRASYRVVSRLAAGSPGHCPRLGPADAAQIFTGAPLPSGTVTVAMQEHVRRHAGTVVPCGELAPAGNIRRRGEDVRRGEILVRAGSVLDARHIAILAASGLDSVAVHRSVRVALLSTGDELRDPGRRLAPASIHDSNRWMLMALLQGPAVSITDLGILPDRREAIVAALQEAGSANDLVISTGGVAVGEEDHLKAALVAAGGRVESWQMAVKPGKPVLVGSIGGALLVGLPGNPFAALVDFQLIARPIIQSLAGATPAPLRPVAAKAGFSWSRRPGRAEFFPVAVTGYDDAGRAVLDKLGKGGSARLKPLIDADGLGMVAARRAEVEPGSAIDWYPFTCSISV